MTPTPVREGDAETAATRFGDVVADLPLDVGTFADQRVVLDALDALVDAAARALRPAP